MASENISFDNIPASIRKPGKYFEFNTRLAVRTLPNNMQKMLIVAQRLASGSIAELVPVQCFSDAQVAEYFGYGSHCHLMATAAINANPYLDLTVVALDDAATAVEAEGTVTIGGAATSSGSVKLYINNKKIEVGIESGDAAADIAAAIVAEAANYPELPVTLVVNGSVNTQIDVTAKNGGTVGNQIGITADISAAGVTATIVAMSGGAVDPDIDDALAVVFGEQYHIIATALNDQTSLTALSDHLDAVSGPLEQRPGRGIYATTGSLAAATTLAGQINSGRMNHVYLRGTRSNAMELAAGYAAIMAFEEDPAMPLNTLEIKKIHAPAVDQRLSRTEQESLLHNGVSPLEVGPGEAVQIVRAITTYTLDAQGIEDVSLLDTTTIATLDYTRRACRERIALRFPRAKLSSKTPDRVRNELIDVLIKLEQLEILEEVEANLDALLVERDLQDANRLDAKIPADVVNGLHVFAGRIDLLL